MKLERLGVVGAGVVPDVEHIVNATCERVGMSRPAISPPGA